MIDLIKNSSQERDIHILCVDDEDTILRSLNRVLRGLGSHLHFAQNAEKAISILQNHQIDILLSDMRMPGMDGAALLSETAEHHPNTKRILMTGYSDMDSTIKAINDGGIEHFVKKPWDSKELVELLQSLINAIQLEDENKSLQIALRKSHQALKQINKDLDSKVKLRTKQIRKAMAKIENERKATEKVLYNVLIAHPSYDAVMGRQIAQLNANIGRLLRLDEERLNTFYLAGLLFELGAITLDPVLLEKSFLQLNYEQQKLFYTQVDTIPVMLSPVAHLQELQAILCQQFEGYARENGYPALNSGQDIPLGARILTISRDYYAYRAGKMASVKLDRKQTLKEMKKGLRLKYDPEVFALLVEHQDTLLIANEEQGLLTKQLEPGMILQKPLFAQNHVMLLSEGHEFTSATIEKLVAYERNQKLTLQIWANKPVK